MRDMNKCVIFKKDLYMNNSIRNKKREKEKEAWTSLQSIRQHQKLAAYNKHKIRQTI